ncbi:MAG: exodeoxyribonuclease VII large subunit [Anaerolineae bacterium]|nr:exodeoxyribonuclease VII large subunit [Anaerolineae bacterium]MEB2289024.1 exodeoxyribonuclease VII large subunit [Anaerolineae bacterium]
MTIQPYTIWQLTSYIRDLFDQDPRLFDVWVEGEISNFARASSGHLYFTLKDDRSELRCVMWRAQAARLAFDPQHGDAVIAHGSVTVYEARGQYQLQCDALQIAGAGDLNRQFELLKARLDAEGLFDPARKRPLPPFPRRIGVVTSPTTAAFQDILNVLSRRYPLAEIILSPTLVQGKEAPPQIIAALRRLNEHSAADVILLARGGGSLEDLWCFNDEAVVRAVVASRIPVVTGVGHEIDFTLVDFAADLRAPTPSAAAEVITPDGPAMRATVEAWSARLAGRMAALLTDRRAALYGQARLLGRLSPAVQVRSARQQVDDLLGRAGARLQLDLERRRERLAAQTRALDSASPLRLLQRGYAIVARAEDGARVTSVQHVAEDMPITITLHDGQLAATVRRRLFGA